MSAPGSLARRVAAACLALTLPCAYLGDRAGEVLASASDPLLALAGLPGLVAAAVASAPLAVGTSAPALAGALLGAALPWCAGLAAISWAERPTRPGEEHGSSRFADPSELAGYARDLNPDPRGNSLVLTKNVGLAWSRTGWDKRYNLNSNVLVIGASGGGKTRYYVKPNIARMATDFIVTDPKGDAVTDCGGALQRAGYDVSLFDTFHSDRSLTYNPLHYVRTDLEVEEFANLFVEMTKGDERASSDPFWPNSEIMLYTALIAFLRDYMDPEDYSMDGLMRLLSMAKVLEDREDYESALDKAFLQIETGYVSVPADQAPRGAGPRAVAAEGFVRRPSRLRRRDGRRPYDNRRPGGMRGFSPRDDFALYNYKAFKQAAGKTLKSILISCSVRLKAFATSEVRAITAGPDQMHLERFGDPEHPRAIFAVFKDTEQATLGFLHGMLIFQAINVLCDKAVRYPGNRLPRPVHFFLDEYRSLSLPREVSALISVIRSRNLSMSIMLQGVSQLGELYDEHAANSIMACCDTTLFLGSDEAETRRFVSEKLGNATIVEQSVSSQHGQSGGWSKSTSRIERPLMTPDEVGRLDPAKAIVFIRGSLPCIDDKYPLEGSDEYALVNGSVPYSPAPRGDPWGPAGGKGRPDRGAGRKGDDT